MKGRPGDGAWFSQPRWLSLFPPGRPGSHNWTQCVSRKCQTVLGGWGVWDRPPNYYVFTARWLHRRRSACRQSEHKLGSPHCCSGAGLFARPIGRDWDLIPSKLPSNAAEKALAETGSHAEIFSAIRGPNPGFRYQPSFLCITASSSTRPYEDFRCGSRTSVTEGDFSSSRAHYKIF